MRLSAIAAISTTTALLILAGFVSSCAGPASQKQKELTAAAAKPAVKPIAKPVVKPTAGAAAKPAVKPCPATRPAARPAVKPATRPAARPAVKPATRPAARPAVKPTTRPATCPTSQPATKPATPPRVIITIGKTKIMSDRLDKALARFGKLSPAQRQRRTERLYSIWIQDDMITAYLKKLNYPPKAMAEARKEFALAQIRDKLVSDTMTEMMRKQKAGIKVKRPSMEDLEAKAQKLAESPENCAAAIDRYKKRRSWDDQRLTLVLKYRIMGKLASSPEKVAEFIASHPVSFFDGTKIKVKHLLIAYKPWDSPEVKARAAKKIRSLAEEIGSGRITFEDAAKKYSDDPSSKKDAILGPFTLSRMVPAFATPVNALKVGELSQPIHTFFGWHLVQVIERTDGDGKIGKDVQKIVAGLLRSAAIQNAITVSARELPVRIYE